MLKSLPSLLIENAKYSDMIFRDSCDIMKRHPDYINYGNSPPVGDNLFRINRTSNSSNNQESNFTKIPNPDYHFRRMYKVDWKVCFLKWALNNNKMAEYHVFVEDDSFVCSENLIHQTTILYNQSQSELLSSQERVVHSFRAGTSMYDGFDDSSTFMTK